MLSRARHGPGGKCATPSRRESKVVVVLQWQQPRRLCRVWGSAAGCGLVAEAEVASSRAAAAASQATGLSRPQRRWIWLSQWRPTKHLRRGALDTQRASMTRTPLR